MADIDVSIDSLNNGAVRDLFAAELDKVLANIADINTNPEAVREIVITAKFKPDESRSVCNSLVQVKSKIAPIMPHK